MRRTKEGDTMCKAIADSHVVNSMQDRDSLDVSDGALRGKVNRARPTCPLFYP